MKRSILAVLAYIAIGYVTLFTISEMGFGRRFFLQIDSGENDERKQMDGKEISNTSRVSRQKNYSCNCSKRKYESASAVYGHVFGFYNVFVGHDSNLTKRIVEEQVNELNTSRILGNVTAVKYSIFGPNHASFVMPDAADPSKFISSGYSQAEGDERNTLELVHRHCLLHRTDRVIYIHTKGSFHPSSRNDRLRQNLMKAVIHCVQARLLDQSDVCGLRFAAIPYPHISGGSPTARDGRNEACHNF